MTEAAPTGVLWARVSTAEQTLGYSLEAQVALLEKASADYKPIPIRVVETFKVHETGSRSARRKHFRQMVEFVRSHNVGFIVAFKIDRLARNWRDFFTLQELIEKGVSVFIVADGRTYDNRSTSTDRFHFRVLGATAQLEAEQIGERTALGMQAKLRRGQITWEAPIGYLNVEDPADASHRRRTVIVDEKRAPHVQWAFERYATGRVPISALTDQLNARGLRSKPNKKGETFAITRRTVEVMLHNRFYISEFFDRKAKEWRRHSYPCFIEPELWLAVQKRLKDNLRNSRGRRDRERFFFKPFLKCGYCGAQITAYSPKPGQVYYDCTQSHVKKNGKKRCSESIIYPEAKIDAMLTKAVSTICINDTIASRLKSYLAEQHQERKAGSARRRRWLAEQIARMNSRLDTLYQDRLDGLISRERFETVQDQTLAAIAAIENEASQLTAANAEYREQGSQLLDLLKDLKGAYTAGTQQDKAAILSILLKRATLRGTEVDWEWQPPFDALYAIGQLALNGRQWGE